jgi:photosystem II stability/assembly factor-like uncharacterized protein
MLEQNLQHSYYKSIAALVKSLAVCFIVLLSLRQSTAQSPLNVWRNTLPDATIFTVIVDPFNPNIIYAGGPNGSFKSVNNGASWVTLDLEETYDLSVDRINPNTIYAAANGGVYKSTDGGLNWINLNSPGVSRVQVSPSDPNFIVAADYYNNVYVTNNGGASWETRPFPPFEYRDAFEIDPQNPNNIYTAYIDGDFIFLRRSNNGGASWTNFFYGASPTFTTTTFAFKVDPNNPNIVYASALSLSLNNRSLYKSTNGGANWTERGAMPYSPAMAISPQIPGIIYAATSSGGIQRSLDDGVTWSDFSVGLSGQSINDFAFDRSGRFLHAATAAGVFSVRLQPTENADFDGDGRADISVFRPSDRTWYLNQSTNGFSATQWGLSTDKLAPADYDGDGRTDISVYRDGMWYWLNSSTGSFNARQFGIASDIPVPANYYTGGNGGSELAVYRSGTWWILNLSNNQITTIPFGLASDKPVASDYDGDGRADCAVYRNGIWYLNRSTHGFAAVQFGIAGDRPLPADYDGDGKTDLAVYRDGTWYLLQSINGFAAFQFGIASDMSAPADYDGDGRADAAVFRNGVWYLRQSTSGFAIQQFGFTNDKPVPSAYLP